MSDSGIFKAAVKLPPQQRPAYLDQACGDDRELRQEVESLLRAHDSSSDFLEQPAAKERTHAYSITEGPGVVIGPYKLREQIGEGGFGVVYVAEQEKPVSRKVALKIIKPGMDSRDIIARFEAERQALALMDHPHVAKVLDAGATESGRPYFVMELVKGVPITDFCDDQKLPTRERLQIFVDVCRAVQHAHQKGIIHRDLKPSNVMVTMHDDKAVAKVIDFGVSKALSQKLTDKSVYTAYGQMVGTPMYMSPEQAQMSGLDVDTRSDVYSLGVLLYELLTGTTPFDKETLKKASFDELRRIIREDEPPRPSARISTLNAEARSTVSEKRQVDPRKLSQSMRGELDWIVMKALEKDRQRRYESASALAADVERHLKDEPVHACPPSLWYQFRKFARRRKGSFVAAAVVVLFLVMLGGGIGWVSRDRAIQQDKTEYAVQLALKESEDLQKKQQWDEAVSVAKRAKGIVDGGVASTEMQQRVRRRLADLEMVVRLEKIHLDKANVAITKNEGSTSDYVGEDKAYAKAFREYGIDVEKLGPNEAAQRIRATSVPAELIVALDDWAATRKGARKADPRAWKHVLAVARAADADRWRNQLRAAWEQDDRKSVLQLAASVSLADLPARTLRRLGIVLRITGAKQEAVSMLRQAQELHPNDFWINVGLEVALRATQPDLTDERLRCLLIARALRPRNPNTHLSLGTLFHETEDWHQASIYFKKAIALQPDFAMAYNNLGTALFESGKIAEGIADFKEAIRLKPDFGMAYSNLGYALSKMGKHDEAIAACKKAIRLNKDELAAYQNLGFALANKGDLDSAIAAHKEAIRVKKDFPFAYNSLAHALIRKRQYKEAIAAAKEAIRLKKEFPSAHLNLGTALIDSGKVAEGIAATKEAIRLKPNIPDAHFNLGNGLLDKGDLDGAIAAYKEAIRLNKDLHAVVYFNLGLALKKKGLFKQTIAAYRESLRLAPGLAELKDSIKECEHLSKLQGQLRKHGVELGVGKTGLSLQGNIKLIDERNVKGKLTQKSPLLDRKHHALHKLKVHAGKIYQIDFESTDFDPLLLLKDATGKVVARNDDGGVGRNARLIVFPERPGTYDVVAMAFQPGATGNYTLRIWEYLPPGKGSDKIKAGSPKAYLNLGIWLFKSGDLDKAITPLKDAIRLKPNYPDAHFNLGNGLSKKGDLDGAIAAYNEAIRLKKDFAAAHLSLGAELIDSGKVAEGIAATKEAIRLQPKNPYAHFNLGNGLLKKHDVDGAIAAYQEAIRLKKDFPAYLNLGVALRKTGNTKAAIAAYKEAIRLDPKFAPAINGLAWLFATCTDPKFRDAKQAVELGRKATELSPMTANNWGTLGTALYYAGDWKAAIESLNRANALGKESFGYQAFFLGMSHWQLGDKKQARQWYGRAVTWMNKNKRNDEELRRFRTEAATLLGIEKSKQKEKN